MNSTKKNLLMDKGAIKRAIDRLALEIAENFPGDDLTEMALLGIQSRGVLLAQRLSARLEELTGNRPLFGKIDTSMYRDDIGMRKTLPIILETKIPFDVNGRHIVLVDDVLWTGRTIRAALDAITDYGRPKAIRLAVLMERKGREFPIHAEYVGMKCSVSREKRVYVKLEDLDIEDAVYVKLYTGEQEKSKLEG